MRPRTFKGSRDNEKLDVSLFKDSQGKLCCRLTAIEEYVRESWGDKTTTVVLTDKEARKLLNFLSKHL